MEVFVKASFLVLNVVFLWPLINLFNDQDKSNLVLEKNIGLTVEYAAMKAAMCAAALTGNPVRAPISNFVRSRNIYKRLEAEHFACLALAQPPQDHPKPQKAKPPKQPEHMCKQQHGKYKKLTFQVPSKKLVVPLIMILARKT